MTKAIDALIAEHVFEIIMPPNSEYIRNYSTSIADAWLVVEKLSEFRVCTVTTATVLGRWVCMIEMIEGIKGVVCETSDTAEMAICIAALKSLGIEVPDE